MEVFSLLQHTKAVVLCRFWKKRNFQISTERGKEYSDRFQKASRLC